MKPYDSLQYIIKINIWQNYYFMIQSITHSLEELYHNPVTWIVATVFFLLIIAIRLYCRGGVCTVDRNLTGQVIVITGGSAGIGKETVKAFASKGCTIIFGARDKGKSERLVKQIQKNNTGCKVYFFPLDLADKKSIQVFSEIISDTCQKIDILINNAGLLLPDRRQTKDGFEMNMGVNHLGHFYLTYLLWNLIKSAQKPRIINVSASLHNSKRKEQTSIDFDDINYKNHFDYLKAYARSKLANILFSKQLQRKMDEAKMCGFAYSLHPGVIMTEIAREFGLKVNILKVIFWPLIALCFKSYKEGAQTTLYLVLQDDSKLQKGGYYGDCKLQKNSDFSQDISNASQLWKVSEKQLNIEFKI